MDVRPFYRSNDLLTQELNGELLIYDLRIDKAYRLNSTLADIWQFCDGKHSVTEISEQISRRQNAAIGEDLIWLGLDQLRKSNLIENGEEIKTTFEGKTRREVIRKIGLASLIALPMLFSVVAPEAVNAASTSVECRKIPASTPALICYTPGCAIGTCSGFSCQSPATLGDQPNSICCSGTQYGVATPGPGVNSQFYCR